jgi:hypothetical protein
MTKDTSTKRSSSKMSREHLEMLLEDLANKVRVIGKDNIELREKLDKIHRLSK